MTKDENELVRPAVVGRIELAIRFSTSRPFRQRAMWIARELIAEFGEDIGRLALQPTPANAFSIDCRGRRIWDWRLEGALPDAERIIQLVRQEVGDQEIATGRRPTLPPVPTGARRIGERAPATCP